MLAQRQTAQQQAAVPPDPLAFERIDRARRALDALASLVGSASDLHTVPADGLATLIDIIVQELPAD